MFGHSRGAAATPEVMFRDPRVVAGVGLDIGTILFGDPPGEVVAAGLDRAFETMCSLDLRCDLPFIVDFVSHLRGPHPVEQLDILHTGYTDFVVFNPEARVPTRDRTDPRTVRSPRHPPEPQRRPPGDGRATPVCGPPHGSLPRQEVIPSQPWWSVRSISGREVKCRPRIG